MDTTLQRLTAAIKMDPFDYEAVDALQREQVRRGLLPKLGKSAVARIRPGHWELDNNDVWNVPEEGGELRFAFKYRGSFGGLVSLSGIAVDKYGNVYGKRTLSNPQESGYQMEGRVSIGGSKFRAFTSSQLFQRPDKSLVDVGVLWVIHPEDMIKADD